MQVVVFGKEFKIPIEDVEEIKENLVSLIREADPELASELEGTPYEVRQEGGRLIVYRTDVIFG